MPFLQTLSSTLPVVFLVALGVVLRRVSLVREETISDLKTLIVTITLPLVLFKAFGTMQFELRYLVIVASVFIACVLIMLLSARLRFIPGLDSPFSSYLMVGFEAGMLGYAVFGAIYGQENISRFAVIDLGQVLFVFFVLITRLKAHQGGRMSLGETLRVFLESPVILGILAGILANVSGLYRLLDGWELSGSLLRTAEILAGLTMPLVALVIGYELRFQAGRMARPLLTTALRLVVWVLLALGFNALVMRPVLGLDRTFEAAVLLMAVLPGPFVIPLYLKEGEQDERAYIVNTLSLGTLAALAAAVLVRLAY